MHTSLTQLLWLLGSRALGLNVSRQKALGGTETQAASGTLRCIELFALVSTSCPFVSDLGVRLVEVTGVDLIMHVLHRCERLQILVTEL